MEYLNETRLWTAMVTPFDSDSKVDYESFEKILKLQAEASNGVLVLGSTGENLALSLEEKKQIVEFTLSLKLKTPLMVGVGGFHLEETKAWIEYLETLNVDCYLLVTPLYAKPSVVGQTKWFKELLDLSTKPCMLYNVPSRTGVELNFQAVENLKDHPRFWAIKEASGSVEKFARYRQAAPTVSVYSGDDGLLPQFALHGCSGLVSVASNVWPVLTHNYVALSLSFNLGESRLNAMLNAVDELFSVPNPIPAKAIMKEMSLIKESKLRAPLTIEELKTVDNLVQADKLLKETFENLY